MSIHDVIIDEIRRVAEEHKKTLAPLDWNVELLSVGLDSLCFAVLVARLEERLDVDPFATTDDFALPVTIGDFVELYDHALA
jgi:acyl carrier protein